MFEYTDNINIREIYQKDKQAFRSFLKLPDSFCDLEMDQKNKYHSLNVIEHTFQVIDNINPVLQYAYKSIPVPELPNKKILFYTALFHDLGKLDPRSQKIKPDGCMSFYGSDIRLDKLTHEASSFLVWQNFVIDKNFTQNEIDTIGNLIYAHMTPHALLEIKNKDKFRHKILNYKLNNSFWWRLFINGACDSLLQQNTEKIDYNLSHKVLNYKPNNSFWWHLFIHGACDSLAKQNTEKIDYNLSEPYFDCFIDIVDILNKMVKND